MNEYYIDQVVLTSPVAEEQILKGRKPKYTAQSNMLSITPNKANNSTSATTEVITPAAANEDISYYSSILKQVNCSELTEGEWWEVIACISKLTNQSPEGLALVDKFSATDTTIGSDGKPRYNAKTVEYQYSRCNNDKEHLVGLPRLIEIATKYGYVDPNKELEHNTLNKMVKQPNAYNMIVKQTDNLLPDIDMLNTKGLAYKAKEIFGTGLCYIREMKSWAKFHSNGKCWVISDRACTEALLWLGDRITEHVRTAKYDSNTMKKYHRFVKELGSYAFLEGAGNLLKQILSRSIEDFDNDKDLINCNGVIVNKVTKEKRNIEPTDLFTKCCGYVPTYDGMEYWQHELDTIVVKEDGITPDKEVQDLLQCLFGNMILGSGGIFSIFYGTGGNGKSTLLDCVSKVLAPTISPEWDRDTIEHASYSIATDILDKSTVSRFSTSVLIGALMAVQADLDKSTAPSDGIIKNKLAPRNQRVDYEIKGGKKTSFEGRYSFFSTCNSKPKIAFTDEGTWSRIMVVPFYHSRFPNDPNHVDKLVAKCGGAILQWVLDGADKVLKYGTPDVDKRTNIPDSIYKINRDYRKEQGLPYRIVEAQELVVDGTGEVDILTEYKKYIALENGISEGWNGEIILPKHLDKSASWLIKEFQIAYAERYKLDMRRTTIKGKHVYVLTGVHTKS